MQSRVSKLLFWKLLQPRLPLPRLALPPPPLLPLLMLLLLLLLMLLHCRNRLLLLYC